MSSQQPELPFRVFDRDEEILVIDRRLPHWSQPGTLCFITLRTWDSMPAEVLERWIRERNEWLKRHGIEACGARSNEKFDYLRRQLDHLEPRLRREFHSTFSIRWHDELDRCHGDCVLRQRELAEIVATSLKHFDGQRYDLTDFVVMPNHAHLMAAFRDAENMLAQCTSWKQFTGTRINGLLNRRGERFWQQDGFDHLVRSVEQFEFLRQYIADNPKKANLRAGEYIHFSKELPRHR